MSGKIRYIFSDLDGTLLNNEKCVSEKTLALIAEIREKYGVKFGVATGRDPASLMPLLVRTGLDQVTDAIVANNGVETVFCDTGERKYLPKVSKEKILELLNYYKDEEKITLCFHNPDCFFSTKDGERAWAIAKLNNKGEIRNPLEDDSYQPTPRVMLMFDMSDYAFVRKLAAACPIAGLRPVLSEKGIFEYLDERVSKEKGVSAYVARFEHSLSDVLAFGDSDNDLDLLRECGLSVAMKNGTQVILDAADDISEETCDDEGVYRYLKSHLALFEADAQT